MRRHGLIGVVVVALAMFLGGAVRGSASAMPEPVLRDDAASASAQQGGVEREDEEHVRVGVTPGASEKLVFSPEGRQTLAYEVGVGRRSGDGRPSTPHACVATTNVSAEHLTCTGTAGFHRYRVNAASGSGDYTLGYATP